MTGQGKEAFIAAMDVSRETLDRLERYDALLHKWNPAINLVSRNTLSDLWGRHFLDSAQLWTHRPADVRLWADFGSGGGFPGLIVAILATEKAPDMKTLLVESDQRKAAFLSEVIRETGVKAEVLSQRIEAVKPLNADVVSARALAPLPQLLEWTFPHLRPGGRALFLKGANSAVELKDACSIWNFTVEETPSLTDPSAVVLNIGEISHV